MKFTVLTLFPKIFDSFVKTSLIARGISKKIIDIELINFRAWATDAHKSVDDRPYGGGVGMVFRVDIIDRALSDQKTKDKRQKTKVILLTPQGKPFNQRIAERLVKYNRLILIAGHYEGFDERIRSLVDEEISIGDYVLTGGELPAMVVIDAVSRLVPGFLGKECSNKEESFSLKPPTVSRQPSTLLEYPHYTRPEVYTTMSAKKQKKMRVPKVLLSGDHKKIRQWRIEQAIKRTRKRREDLSV